MDDAHYQFASDWANILITSFVEQQATTAAAAKIKLTDEEPVTDAGDDTPSGGVL